MRQTALLGEVFTWGAGENGQLGHPGSALSPQLLAHPLLEEGEAAVGVGAGAHRTCIFTSRGSAILMGHDLDDGGERRELEL